MSKLPSKETVMALRKQYPQGTRVVLVRMNDTYTKLRPGDLGTVEFIDDAGTLFCRWDKTQPWRASQVLRGRRS